MKEFQHYCKEGDNGMKKSRVLIAVLIIITALAGGIMIYFENSKRLGEIDVYVVQQDIVIEPNEKITKDKVTKVKRNPFYLPEGTILDNSMIDKYAISPLHGGRGILNKEISDNPNVDTQLGYNLKPGERIISLTVNNAESIGGILNKGQFIDLHWIRELEDNKESKIIPLYSHVEILDIRTKEGLSIHQKEGNKEGSKINVINADGNAKKDIYPLEVVVRVTVEQARDIKLAKASGKIAIVLNPHKQSDDIQTTPINTLELGQLEVKEDEQ
jgi:Flp pilus assembly protein CpaB